MEGRDGGAFTQRSDQRREKDTKPCLWQEWLGVASVAPELS